MPMRERQKTQASTEASGSGTSAMLQTVTLPCSFWHRSKLWVVRSARDRVRDIWASPQPRSAMTRAPGVLLSQLMAREMGRTGQDLVCCLSEG